MLSIRSTLAVLALVVAGSAQAITMTDISHAVAENIVAPNAGLVFKVGDEAAYKLAISSFINGTMDISVKSVDTNAVVLDQSIAVMGQNQSCEETINPNTGAVTNMVCNGKPQDPGSSSDIEVVDSKEESVTVPAGTFDCLWIKAHNKKDNTDIEQWINPKLIPVLGLAKMNAPTQMGVMVVELTSFKKN